MEDLFKALGIFQQGVQEAAIAKGINDATTVVDQLRNNVEMDTQQKIAAQKQVANQLMAQLSAAGAPASRIQSAAAGLMPEMPQTSRDAFALAQQTGDPYYMKMAKDMQGFETNEQRMREQFEAGEAEKQRNFMERMKRLEAGKAGAKMSPFEQTLDQENAKRLIDYKPETFASGLTLMTNAKAELEKIKNDMTSGGIPGRIAGAIPGSKTARIASTVQAAVQDQLKPIYGSQFTEKEGERFFKSIFDPGDPEGSLQRMDIFMQRMQVAEKAMRDMREYALTRGTTVGFRAPDGYELLRDFQKLGGKGSAKQNDNDKMIDVKGASQGASRQSAIGGGPDPRAAMAAEILKRRRQGK